MHLLSPEKMQHAALEFAVSPFFPGWQVRAETEPSFPQDRFGRDLPHAMQRSKTRLDASYPLKQ